MTAAPRFQSAAGPVFARYLAVKRALGVQAATLEDLLAQLDRFLAATPVGDLTGETFARWETAMARLAGSTRRQRLRTAYRFCLFRRRSDPHCFLPDPSQFPPRDPRRMPYIFSEADIVRLLRTAATLAPHAASPLFPEVSRLAVVLLYTTGLRRGELARLQLGDYDPATRVLWIRDTKFGKSRLVPVSPDTAAELARYLAVRQRPGFPDDPAAPLLLHRHGRLTGYTGAGCGQLLRALMQRAGLRTSRGRIPRVHDLRFTFAVQALRRWYQAGVDVQARLPALATYLGHSSVVSTQYYLTGLEAVTEAASARFHAHCAGVVLAPGLQEVRDESPRPHPVRHSPPRVLRPASARDAGSQPPHGA